MKRFATCLFLLTATAARAQPMDVYGFNPRSLAMGGVQAASAKDFSAVYYNPALLREASFGLGVAYSRPFVGATATAEPQAWQTPVDPQLPPDYLGITTGFAVSVGGVLRGRLTAGVAAYIPKGHVFRSRLFDESTPTFYRYDSPPERLQLVLGLSARPVEWLSLGAGAQVLSNYGGVSTITANLGTTGPGHVVDRTLDSEVTGEASPVVGLAVGPFHGAQVLATWRGEHKTNFTMPIGVNMGAFGSIDVSVEGVMHYSPNTVVLGATTKLLSGRLELAADVDYQQWSKAPPPVAVVNFTLPETLVSLGFNRDVVSRPVDMGFVDTFTPRLGAEWTPTDAYAVRLGYCFRPTMVPDQTGRSNFLDSNAHLVSAGVGVAFEDPLGWAKRLWLEGAAQWTLLSQRQVTKQGVNATPDYRFGGSLLDLTVAARYEL